MANVYERLAKAEQDARNAVYFAAENKAITELNILKGNIKDEVWEADHDYTKGDIFRYLDAVYEVVQSHRSQADWTPDITPALYKKTTEEGEIPVWVQPTGAQDAYNTGDKVWYPEENTTVYESLIDANVWSPVDYPQGWKEVTPDE